MLVQSNSTPEVRFDSALLDQETVDAILTLGTAAPRDVEMGVQVARSYAALTDAQVAQATFNASEIAPLVQQALEAMKADPDLAAALGQGDAKGLEGDILKALQKGLTEGADHAASAASMQNTIHEFFNWKDTGNETVLTLAGEPVMTAVGAKREVSKKAVQTFWVVLDVCCLLYAILDLPQCRPAKDAVVNLLKKLGKWISAGASRFMSLIRQMLPSLSEAQRTGRLAEAVKEVALGIGRAVAGTVEALWKHKDGLSGFKNITLAVFQAAMSSWLKALYYVGQFIAGAIALISGIGAMVKKVVALIAALATLIYDVILLSQMSDRVSAKAA